MYTLYQIFTNLLVLISLILPVLYLRGYRKLGNAYKLITWYLILVAVIQIFLTLYAYNKWNNLFMSHFYFIGQFTLLSMFYNTLLKKKWIFWVLVFVLLGLVVQYILDPSIFFVFNSYGMSVTQTILVLYAFLYFQKSLTIKGGFLYINTGVLFYLITSVLYFASYNLFLELEVKNKPLKYIYWLHQLLYFVFEILIFVEWYKNYRVISTTTTKA